MGNRAEHERLWPAQSGRPQDLNEPVSGSKRHILLMLAQTFVDILIRETRKIILWSPNETIWLHTNYCGTTPNRWLPGN